MITGFTGDSFSFLLSNWLVGSDQWLDGGFQSMIAWWSLINDCPVVSNQWFAGGFWSLTCWWFPIMQLLAGGLTLLSDWLPLHGSSVIGGVTSDQWLAGGFWSVIGWWLLINDWLVASVQWLAGGWPQNCWPSKLRRSSTNTVSVIQPTVGYFSTLWNTSKRLRNNVNHIFCLPWLFTIIVHQSALKINFVLMPDIVSSHIFTRHNLPTYSPSMNSSSVTTPSLLISSAWKSCTALAAECGTMRRHFFLCVN